MTSLSSHPLIRFTGLMAAAGIAAMLSGCVVAPIEPRAAVVFRGPPVYVEPAPVVVVPGPPRYYGYPGYRGYWGGGYRHWR